MQEKWIGNDYKVVIAHAYLLNMVLAQQSPSLHITGNMEDMGHDCEYAFSKPTSIYII